MVSKIKKKSAKTEISLQDIAPLDGHESDMDLLNNDASESEIEDESLEMDAVISFF